MKHINIYSYWSELNNQLEAIYSIDYPDSFDIEHEIEKAYEEMADAEMENGSLDRVLDYLKENNVNLKYETIPFVRFDCDYGEFDKFE
jgi:hypothetical protein